MQQHTLKPKHSLANYMYEWRQHSKTRRQLSFASFGFQFVQFVNVKWRPFALLFAVAWQCTPSSAAFFTLSLCLHFHCTKCSENENHERIKSPTNKSKGNHLNYLWNRMARVFILAFVVFPSFWNWAIAPVQQQHTHITVSQWFPVQNENVRNVAANRLKYIPNNANGLFMWPNRLALTRSRSLRAQKNRVWRENGLQHAS